MRQRGFTLIELMISVAVISAGGAAVYSSLGSYQRTATRAFQTEGLARVLDIELEAMRACPTRTCLVAFDTKSATVATTNDDSNSWVRASVRRAVRPGPDQTMRVTVEAMVPRQVRPVKIEALLAVPR